MSKAILRFLIISGIVCICAFGASAQEFITRGWLPYQYLGLKNVPIHRYGDTLYAIAGDDSLVAIFRKNGIESWQELSQFSWSDDIQYFEFFLNQHGLPIIYNAYNGVLSRPGDIFYEEYDCPGRPISDARDNIHVIWHSGNDTTRFFYGYSTDTLRTFAIQDTIVAPPTFVHLVSSPNDSIVGAIFYNYQTQTILKYLAINGEAIDFSTPPGSFAFSYWLPNAYDVTLDNSGNLYFVMNTGGIGGAHCAWSEEFGLVFLEQSGDDYVDSPAFEFSFGPNDGEILLIKNGTPPYGFCASGFFASTDAGATWYVSLYEYPVYPSFYGSAPRTYSDTIDYLYFADIPFDNVFYCPIPRETIFSQLVAIEREEAPVPDDISLLNYPNPFNSRTNIVFNLPATSDIELSVYDITGSKVAVLASGRVEAGSHSVTWDGHNKAGHPVSSGIYFYKISINGNHRASKSMLLLK